MTQSPHGRVIDAYPSGRIESIEPADFSEDGVDSGIPHGTVSGYSYHWCRCDDCREAKRQYDRLREANRPPRGHWESAMRHGTRTKYRSGCRCHLCRAAMSLWDQKHKGRRPRPRRHLCGPQNDQYGQCGTMDKYAAGCRCWLCEARWQIVKREGVESS